MKCVFGTTVGCLLMGMACSGQYIHLQGDRFIDEHGDPFYPMIMNYYVDYVYQSPNDQTHPDLTNPVYSDVLGMDIVAISNYGSTGAFDFLTIAEGQARILQELTEMKAMGFNTIRLCSRVKKLAGQPGHTLMIKRFPSGQGVHEMQMLPPYTYDSHNSPVCWLFLNSILTVCSLANTLDMKVFLEPSMSREMIDTEWNSLDNLDRVAFLEAVAGFVHDNNIHNLLGYDLYGEPSLADRIPVDNGVALPHHSKEDICRLVDTWNTALKTYDPDHLTSVGAGDVDVLEQGWDPMLIATDFAAVHLYEDPVRFQYDVDPLTYQQKAIERYKAKFHWYDTYLMKPYIIAETGRSAQDPFNFNGTPNALISYPNSTYGNETDQLDLVTATYPLIRNSRCSGYGWWIFQNDHALPEPTQQIIDDITNTPENEGKPEAALQALSGRYFGILDFGDPNPNPGPGQTGYEAHRKLTAQQFVDWRTTPPVQLSYSVPASIDMSHVYYNQHLDPPNPSVYLDPDFNSLNYGTLTGRVLDQNGDGIAGALVSGYSESWNYNGYPQGFTRNTYTDVDGNFEIRVYDPYQSNYADLTKPLKDKVFVNLSIGAYACSNVQVGWNGGTFEPYHEYALNSVQAEHERHLANVTIPSGTTAAYAAIRSLEATNVTIAGTVDLKAGQDVLLHPSFHAAQGSEVLIHLEPLGMECTTVAAGDLHMPVTNTTSGLALSNAPKETRDVTVEFHGASSTPSLSVYPSPTEGTATVLLQAVQLPCRIEVFDASGRKVLSAINTSPSNELQLVHLAPGEYTVMAYASGRVLHRAIIKK